MATWHPISSEDSCFSTHLPSCTVKQLHCSSSLEASQYQTQQTTTTMQPLQEAIIVIIIIIIIMQTMQMQLQQPTMLILINPEVPQFLLGDQVSMVSLV